MTVERADLSASLNPERMAPTSPAPSVQGQSLPEDREGKGRRRPPPEKFSAELSVEPSAEPSEAEEIDRPPHRIDSLA
jgi:hypothetical protein